MTRENCELMSQNKSGHISKSNEGYCVYYPPNIFHNTRSFENWGTFSDIFGWGIFSHVTPLDQSRSSENITWIIITPNFIFECLPYFPGGTPI